MDRGQNDHIGPGAQLDDAPAPVERLMPHVHDIYAALGVEWGGDPFPAISALKANGRVNVVGIALVCYNINSVYCRLIGDTPRDWEECKNSVISGVEKALAGATPEALHDAWCEFQRADGWVHGETKDPLAKTHPCLVPYDQLPVEQRNKDQFFLAVVDSLKPYL